MKFLVECLVFRNKLRDSQMLLDGEEKMVNFRVKDITLHFADRCFLIKHFLFIYDKAFFVVVYLRYRGLSRLVHTRKLD